MYDRILIPTDGSENAAQAAIEAMRFASVYDATVHVLSVVDTTSYRSSVLPDDLVQRSEEMLTERGEEAVLTVEDIAAKADRSAVGDVWKGVPYRAILEYVEENDIDLVVMGTHGRTGLDRYITGSVTERVVRLSDVPVLTVRMADAERESHRYGNILIPTDGSPGAEAAIDHGIDIARRHDATVHALYIVNIQIVAGDYEGGFPATDLIHTLEERGTQAVEVVSQRGEAANVPVRTHVSQGTPYHGIRAYANEHDIDLITMRTHGRTGIDRFLLGSITRKIVRSVDMPVLTVRAVNESS